jgi:hypothetical protein
MLASVNIIAVHYNNCASLGLLETPFDFGFQPTLIYPERRNIDNHDLRQQKIAQLKSIYVNSVGMLKFINVNSS